jgi:hypothetical protein
MRATIVFAALVFALLVLPGSASALDVVHGIGFTKTCLSPTNIGAQYQCSYAVENNIDEAHDTLTVNGLVDVVHSAGGDESSGNVFSVVPIDNCTTASGACTQSSATCTGGGLVGTGTRANPWIGATSCTLPFGSRLNFQSFSHYTVQPADYGLSGHTLTDTASLTWHDLCDDPAGTGNTNCVMSPPDASAEGSTTVQQLSSTTATEIHNAAHQVVTTVEVGTTVHDFVTVTGQPGSPFPSGNVTIEWFGNSTCTDPAAASTTVALAANGLVDATSFLQAPLTAGLFAFRATYLGDAMYAGSVGLCETLKVVDANIQLAPLNARNRVGTNHALTCHINVNAGSGGFTSAPAGTVCIGVIQSGPGSFVGPNQCTTVGTTGSCQLTITSSVTGTTTVQATTTLAVGGVALARATGDGRVGDSANAQKQWVTVNAGITIAPNATNEVGQPHTFTVTVLVDTGGGLQPVGSGLPCNVTLTPANGANPNPSGPFNLTTNANGQCSVTFTSPTAGTVTGNASSTVNALQVSTDGNPPDSGPAVKTFVDANIQLAPLNATNLVNTQHVLICHVNVNTGTGGFANAPAGTTCTGSILSGPGSFVGSNQCAPVGSTGDCQLTITSAVTGTTTVRATTTLTVGGVALTRATGDAHAGDSADATKTWVEVTAVQIASLQASRRPAGVLVRWRMGSEVGVLGYNVYRERRGARIRLNRAVIAARGSLSSRSYSYLDRSAPRARRGLRYWLQVVGTDGSRVWKAVRVP